MAGRPGRSILKWKARPSPQRHNQGSPTPRIEIRICGFVAQHDNARANRLVWTPIRKGGCTFGGGSIIVVVPKLDPGLKSKIRPKGITKPIVFVDVIDARHPSRIVCHLQALRPPTCWIADAISSRSVQPSGQRVGLNVGAGVRPTALATARRIPVDGSILAVRTRRPGEED